MKITTQFDLKYGVHTLSLLDDGTLGVIDISNSYRAYNLESFELLDGFKSQLSENLPYINNMSISLDGMHIALYDRERKDILLYNTKTRDLLHTIDAHGNGVECVAFSKEGKYLISGGMDGKLYMWSVSSGQKVDTLSHHYDSVLTISSSENSRWVATAGYDKVIKVFNRSFRKNHYKLISHQEPVTVVEFLSEQRLISADKDGVILIWDIVKSSVMHRLPKFDAQISALCFDKDEKFLFVAGVGGLVGLYDLAEKKLLKMDYLKQLAGITQIAYCEQKNLLMFGLSNGHLPIYDLNLQESTFIELMKKRSYDECYRMCEDNPLLYYSEGYKTLDSLFTSSYDNAKKLLRAQKYHEAKEILKFFSASSAKRLIIQKLFHDFKLFETFEKAVTNKKYMMAYSLAEEYSTLKETPEFEYMENEWKKVVAVVKKIINDKGSEEKIKQLFKPFMGIPGKNLIIKTLYSNRNVYSLFKKHILAKEYLHAFKLVSGHPFLEELDEYKALISVGKALENKTQDTFNNGSYYDAVKLCEILNAFPKQKEFASELKEKANIYAEVMNYFANKEFGAVYNMIEQHPFLEDAKITNDIEVGYLKYYEKAENYAANGNVQAVKQVMERFSKIASKVPSIKHLIKISYWSQIEQAARAKCSDTVLKDAFAAYDKVFGYESMLEDLVKQINGFRKLTVAFNTTHVKENNAPIASLQDRIINY